MKYLKHIPKIAFFISAAALLFSIATLIRTIVIHQTQFIWLSILQVVGTALIMGICAIVIFISKNNNYYDLADEETDYKKTEQAKDHHDTTRFETHDNIYDLPEVEDRDMDESDLIDFYK